MKFLKKNLVKIAYLRLLLGLASASVAVGRQLAFAIGVAVAGAIFTIREGVYLEQLSAIGSPAATAGADAIARGFADAMLAAVALGLIAVVLSLWARRTRVERPS